MMHIDYEKIARAISLYRESGFTYVETPWIVSPRAAEVTLPQDRSNFEVVCRSSSIGVLVGSAEQSFVELMEQGELPRGMYVAAGPCFRDEPFLDDDHQLTFFKVELIDVGARRADHLAAMAKDVLAKFGSDVELIVTRDGYDIELGGTEIGSYGVRSAYGHVWAYGTGLALPRYDIAVRRSRERGAHVDERR